MKDNQIRLSPNFLAIPTCFTTTYWSGNKSSWPQVEALKRSWCCSAYWVVLSGIKQIGGKIVVTEFLFGVYLWTHIFAGLKRGRPKPAFSIFVCLSTHPLIRSSAHSAVSTMCKRLLHSQKWLKMVKIVENDQNDPKWQKKMDKHGLKWTKSIQTGLKFAKIVQNVKKNYQNSSHWSKIINNGSYFIQNDQKSPKWLKIVLYGLIWSNMVQFLSTKSSKWVWHNQVSRSSFYFLLLSFTW